MPDALQTILDSNASWAVVLLAIAWMFRAPLTALAVGFVDDRKVRRDLERERNTNELAQTQTLRQLGEQLNLSVMTQRQIAELLTDLAVMPTQLQQAIRQMVERSEQRDATLETHGLDHKVIRMNTGAGKGEAWAPDGPRLLDIQGLIISALDSAEVRIVKRLDPGRKEVRDVIREELKSVVSGPLLRRLEALDAALQDLKPGPSPPPQGT